jgi:plasmid rolling circle replication initiator protein Rep
LNNTNPKLLHEYPNNLIIYAVHVLCPFLYVASLSILFFTKNSELKKAGKIWLKNIYDDYFSLVLLQWRLYKKSRKYANTGIELSSFQKAIERTIPPDVLAHGLQTTEA